MVINPGGTGHGSDFRPHWSLMQSAPFSQVAQSFENNFAEHSLR